MSHWSLSRDLTVLAVSRVGEPVLLSPAAQRMRSSLALAQGGRGVALAPSASEVVCYSHFLTGPVLLRSWVWFFPLKF